MTKHIIQRRGTGGLAVSVGPGGRAGATPAVTPTDRRRIDSTSSLIFFREGAPSNNQSRRRLETIFDILVTLSCSSPALPTSKQGKLLLALLSVPRSRPRRHRLICILDNLLKWTQRERRNVVDDTQKKQLRFRISKYYFLSTSSCFI